MTLIFNLDLDNITKVTDYGLDRKKIPRPKPTFYFRLYQNGYDLDMNKLFGSISITIKFDSDSSKIFTYGSSKVVTVNGEKLVEIELDDECFAKEDKLYITPSVKLRNSNKSINLKAFKLIIYEGNKNEMNMIKSAIENFNRVINLYLKAIKRDQINQPNGVIGLDEYGKISKDRLSDNLGKHVEERIFDNEVHGLRLNEDFMLEYFDVDGGQWYEVNSVSGGDFTHPNKEGKDITGGLFTDLNSDLDKNIISGGKWNEYI